ncbi:MAG: SRPBCC family protein [Planctomycetes bacterium]|nr:SRPBCC family protein [Planctomycetota bacterium]
MLGTTFSKGLALGAGLMYWFDPDRGRRRRAGIRDAINHAVCSVECFVDRGLRDLWNRVEGLTHDAQALVTGDDADDRTLEERVRSKIGRYVSHPRAIDVSSHDGRIVLHGSVLADEVDDLVNAVASVRGVSAVEPQLDVYEQPGNVSSLQGGGGKAPGEPIDVMQENWSPATRLLAGAFGTGLMVNCLARRTPGAVLLGTLGFGLFLRGTTNLPTRRLTGIGAGRQAVSVRKAFHVEAPVERVFDFLADRCTALRFLPQVKHVEELGDGRCGWTFHVQGAGDIHIEEEIVERERNHRLSWRSSTDSTVAGEGEVRFESEGDGRTFVDLCLSYNPPAGAIGHAAASLFGQDAKSQLEQWILRIKQYLETGHIPRDIESKLPEEVRQHLSAQPQSTA